MLADLGLLVTFRSSRQVEADVYARRANCVREEWRKSLANILGSNEIKKLCGLNYSTPKQQKRPHLSTAHQKFFIVSFYIEVTFYYLD